MPRSTFAFVCLLWLSLLTAAHSELVFSNYSAAHPLKIMAVGDSITDDCMVAGAWRAYLQTLLETNGYTFTLVGRQTSTASGNFTKTLHEGYCGAVIAPPSPLTYAVHGYAGPDVYLQKIVPEALTNTTPDLVLILIGANDIGRGRDPGLVATNDIPNLLNLIFSNAPNTHILLAKISTIRGAGTFGGIVYGNYANNVSTYNAYLQRVVNLRRAAGQNVWLADMFSVVDSTMLSDKLHPNPTGLQVMAGEWRTRIQSLTVRSNLTVSVLVNGGANWNYFDGGVDLGTTWRQPNFDDHAWSNGPARLGYGDQTVATTISYGSVSTNKYPTTYFRHTFVAPATVTYTNLVLRLAQRGGSVVWLNGQEIWRTNLPSGAITYTNFGFTTNAGTLDTPYQFNSVTIAAAALLPGTNVIAEELHLLTPSLSFAGFDLELLGTGSPSPALALTLIGTNLVFTWPTASGSDFSLYSNTNLTSPNWTPPTAAAQTNGGQLIMTQALDAGAKFFRLQKP